MSKDVKKNMDRAAGERSIEQEAKGKIAREVMSKAMEEERAKGRRIQNITEEIHKLGMTEEEYWKEAMKEGMKNGMDGNGKEERDYLKKLEESGKTPKEKLQAWMQYKSAQAVVDGMEEVYRRKKKSTYRNWGQWNYARTKGFEKVAAKNGLAAAIFLYMARKSDKYNKLICSYKVFQEEFDVSERSVGRAIRLLEENKLITIYKSGTSNVYVLDDNVTWKSEGWRHDYCEFDSKVILARSEQREEKRKKWEEKKKSGEDAEEEPEEGNDGHPEE